MSTSTWLRPGTLAVLVVMVAFGCSSDNVELFAPADCQNSKPATGSLTIEITLNAQNPKVPIKVYDGPVEDGRLVESDSLGLARFTYELPVDHTYSVTARYLVGQDTVFAIGSDDITPYLANYEDDFCWEVSDGKVDVRLKL